MWFAANESIESAWFLSFFPILLRTLNDSNDALPSPYQVTLVGFNFSCPKIAEFPVEVDGVGEFMSLSLREAAFVNLSGTAK